MAADIGLDATTSIDEAFAAALARHGADAKVVVLPFARYQLPRNAVRMEHADAHVFAYAGRRVPVDVTADARRTIPGLRASGVAAGRAVARRDPRLDDDPRAPADVPGRARRAADERDPVPVRPLRRGGPRAADARGEAPSARSPRGARGVPRARGGRAGRRADRARDPPRVVAIGESPRTAGRGSAAPSCGSRTRRCCAARVASSTTSQPVPHAWHAAIVRSHLAHARIAVDPSAALEEPGVRGVLTGADVRGSRRPFPAAIDSPVPHYAAAVETARYVGEPLAVVVARDRYVAEDAAELVAVDYEPLEPVLDPSPRPTEACIHDRSFHYGDVDEALARADLVVRETFRFPRFTCTAGRVLRRRRDWGEADRRPHRLGELPGPVHAARRRRCGARPARRPASASSRRPTRAARSGSSRRSSRTSSCGPRVAGSSASPCAGPRTGSSTSLGSAAATGRVTEVEAGFTHDGELVALRYDAIEDVGAYVRAPEPATLYRMHGSLSGAYRVRNVAARNRVVLTNTLPSGLNRGFGGPQLYFGLERTMAIAARRLGLDPAELARRNLVQADEMPYRTPSGALYDSGDYAACLDDALDARAGTSGLRGRAAAARDDGPARRRRARLRRRAVDLEHGLHHARADGGRARGGAPEVRERRGRARRGRPARRDHRAPRHDTAGPGAPHRRARRSSPTSSACAPEDVTVLSELDTATVAVDGRVGQLLVALLRGRRRGGAARRRGRCGTSSTRSATTSATPTSPLRRVAGTAHWNPEGLPDGMEPGLTAVAFCAAPNLDPPDVEDRVASSGAHGFIVDVCARGGRPRDGRGDGPRLRDRPRRRHAAQPAARRRPGARRLRARRGRGPLRARTSTTRTGNLLTASLVDYLAPTAPDVPALRIGHLSLAVAVHGARRQGARGGEHDVRAGRDRERGRGRARPRRRRAAADRRRASGRCSRTGPA